MVRRHLEETQELESELLKSRWRIIETPEEQRIPDLNADRLSRHRGESAAAGRRWDGGGKSEGGTEFPALRILDRPARILEDPGGRELGEGMPKRGDRKSVV